MLLQLLVDLVHCWISLKSKIIVYILKCNKNKDWRTLTDLKELLMISNQDTRHLELSWFVRMLHLEGSIFHMLAMWFTTNALSTLKFMFIDVVELLVSEEKVILLIYWHLMITNHLNKSAKHLKSKKRAFSDTK